MAELGADDVALEIGPGLGALTTLLAQRCAHVHAVELDRRLEAELAELAGLPNVSLHWGDALRLDLAAFEPGPTKLVANLPYNVATPIVAESLTGLPTVELWCVMVQREVADRFFASPSTKAYGAVSVLIQLAAVRTGFHPVARTVFGPRPTSTRLSSRSVALRSRRDSPGSARSWRVRSPTVGRRWRTHSTSRESRRASRRPPRFGSSSSTRRSGQRRSSRPRSSSSWRCSDDHRAGSGEDQPGTRRRPSS